MAPLKNISGCVLLFGKMSRLTLYLKMRVYHMIIHVLCKGQGPNSTADSDFQVLSEFKVHVT